MAAKRVESFRVPCLDAGSTPATSTNVKRIWFIINQMRCFCSLYLDDEYLLLALFYKESNKVGWCFFLSDIIFVIDEIKLILFIIVISLSS